MTNEQKQKMEHVAIAIKGKYWVTLCRPTSREIAEQFRDAVCRGETFRIVTEKELLNHKNVLK